MLVAAGMLTLCVSRKTARNDRGRFRNSGQRCVGLVMENEWLLESFALPLESSWRQAEGRQKSIFVSIRPLDPLARGR